jgi:methylmalonyl-CoA/ethylmalonyl-CoA epimerase
VVALNGKALKLHHVGYVVADIEKAAPKFVTSIGASWDGNIITDPLQGVRVSFLALAPEDAQLELVEPCSRSAPVAKFLREKGQGLHHLCYEVKDLNVALEKLRAAGNLLAKPPRPAVAFGGRRIAWLMNSEKLLIELLES